MINRPVVFHRGGMFTHTFEIPEGIANGHFSTWLPLAQVRKYANTQPDGFIQELESEWVDQGLARKITVRAKNTEKWPTGLVHLDLLLTSPSGDYYRVDPVLLEVEPGVTVVTP